MKRQRGRGRSGGGKPGGYHHNHHQNPNRSMQSSGPEGAKVHGSASVVHEKYLQYARDAASSGDRVLSENYLQHADHYYRLLRQAQPAQPVQQQGERTAPETDFDGDEEGGPESEALDQGVGDDEQPDVEFPGGQQPQGERGEREGDFRRRGRGRRNRFRPDGERGDRDGEGAQAREDGERGERRERQPRGERGEREGEQQGREGFAGPGPKPAFLGSD